MSSIGPSPLVPNEKWAVPANEDAIAKTVAALKANGFEVTVVANKAEAKATVLSLIPLGAEVLSLSSTTQIEIGVDEEVNNSGKYVSLRQKSFALDRYVARRFSFFYFFFFFSDVSCFISPAFLLPDPQRQASRRD